MAGSSIRTFGVFAKIKALMFALLRFFRTQLSTLLSFWVELLALPKVGSFLNESGLRIIRSK